MPVGCYRGTVEPILGPPGTGKTTALLGRFERELRAGVPAAAVSVVTFTRAARTEFLNRAEVRFSLARDELPWVRTIHSTAYRLLLRPTLVTAPDLREFRDRYGYDLSDPGTHDLEEGATELPRQTTDDLLRHAYEWGRTRCLDPDRTIARYPGLLSAQSFLRFVTRYEAWKAEHRLWDFTDLLERVLRERLRPEVVAAIVDEGQDLSPLQWAVVEMWFADCDRVYIAGDDDQAIYAFQGADSGRLLRLATLYTPTVLAQSYRVPGTVHALAERIVGRNRQRIVKVYRPTPEAGTVERSELERAVAELPADANVLVLCRNRMFLRGIADALMRRCVPFIVEGVGALNPLGSEAVCYAAKQAQRLARGEDLHAAGLAALLEQIPSRGAGLLPHGVKAKVKRMDRRVSLAEMRDSLGLDTLLAVIERNGAADVLRKLRAEHRSYLGGILARYGTVPTPTICLTTIHGSKGREADTVLVVPDMTPATFAEYTDGRHGGAEAETRVAYVATTRTKRRLIIARPSTRRFYDYPQMRGVA